MTVYAFPIKLYREDDSSRSLHALLLKPTQVKHGQYTRVGIIHLNDDLLGGFIRNCGCQKRLESYLYQDCQTTARMDDLVTHEYTIEIV